MNVHWKSGEAMAARRGDSASETEPTQSVHRALAVLEALAARPSGASPKELSQVLGIHLSTSYRLLNTLAAAGYVVRAPRSGLFRLGPRVAYLHHGYLAALAPAEETLAFLHALQMATGETVMLNQLEGDDVVVAAVIAGNRPASHPPGYVGMAIPAYSVAVGRVLLAWQPLAQIASYLVRNAGAPALPPFSSLAPDAFRAEIERIRLTGYALDLGEGNRDVCCVAAPISDATGVVEFGISVVAPCARFRREEPSLVARTLEVARAIGALLSHSRRRAEHDGGDQGTEPDGATQAAMAEQLAHLAAAMSRVSSAPLASAGTRTHPTR
jgi:DNA-binding IclR family transcriptional regulator